MQSPEKAATVKNKINFDKWGYIFIAPFFLVYAIFSLWPLLSTFYNSFFENYMVGLAQVGPKFVGVENYQTVFGNPDMLKYLGNTLIMWVIGFVPQLAVSLLLAFWFSSPLLRIRGNRFFKTVMYMPNLIMAAAFSMLFFTLFADNGPINDIMMDISIIKEPFRFLSSAWATRGLVGAMNFLMWFGNTTILLMAAMMGIDPGLYEAASIDGATSGQVFRQITLPLIRPIMLYVFITSMIGGIQMFDIPQILTNGKGGPARTAMTLVMFLNRHLYSKNYGLAGAVSVVLFALALILSIIVFKFMYSDRDGKKAKAKEKAAAKAKAEAAALEQAEVLAQEGGPR
ncbi:MAG: sugar ABC transporter permease [Clostridiales Family XIII bacterium]|jgi:multiple sugar transport system permease protein|nr:sugar ABC transporter permease [Clostridiales Family XIII bacterium]